MSNNTHIAQQLKSIKQGNYNLYQHLKKICLDLIAKNGQLQSFEQVSFNHKGPQKQQIVFKIRQGYEYLKNYQLKNRALLGKINIGTQEEPQEPTSLGYIPDIIEESRIFEKFGIGFGEDQTYRIFKSIAKFSQKKNAKQTKFWGKILGTQKDYYIIQATADSGQQPGQLSPDTEPKGAGVNKLSYFVTTQLTGQWTQLPLVTPIQIQTSRKIKYLFTGDLNRSIMINPQFSGKQAHLLKCQIIRITATCTIVPKGMFKLNEEDPKQIDSPQDYTFPQISFLSLNQNWVYLNQSILKNGRLTIMKPQGLQPQQQQKAMKKMIQKDPTQPRLKTIARDSIWSIKNVGFEETYKTLTKQQKVVSKGIVGVKNLLWPGWLTVAYSGKQANIYIGYGHKFKQNYYPSWPQTILQEAVDRAQMNDS